MRRVDFRKSSNLFKDIENEMKQMDKGEVVIFLFEIGDFTDVEKSFEFVHEKGFLLMNSLKFNQVDWSITIKRPLQ